MFAVILLGPRVPDVINQAATRLHFLLSDFISIDNEYPFETWNTLSTLFTTVVQTINSCDETACDYFPAMHMLEKCFQDLRERIKLKASNVSLIPDLVFQFPKQLQRLLPSFDPKVDLKLFIPAYKRISLSLQPGNETLISTFLDAFDVDSALMSEQLSFEFGHQFLNCLRDCIDQLWACTTNSKEIRDTNSSLELPSKLLAIYTVHEANITICLRFKFPRLYTEVFALLLHLSSQQQALPSTWTLFFRCVSTFNSTGRALNVQQCCETLQYFAQRSLELRKTEGPLLVRWHFYIDEIIALLEHFWDRCIRNTSNSLTMDYSFLMSIVSPWTSSYIGTGSFRNPKMAPWQPYSNQVTAGRKIIRFTIQAMFHSSLDGTSEEHFQCIWKWYLSEFSSNAEAHVLNVIHGEMLDLDWEIFHMKLPLINDLLSFIDNDISEQLIFVAELSKKLSWQTLFDELNHSVNDDCAEGIHTAVLRALQIFLRLFSLPSIILDHTSAIEHIISLKIYPSTISDDGFQQLVNYIVDVCSPNDIFMEKSMVSLFSFLEYNSSI